MRLKELRLKLGLNQTELADKLNIKRNTYNKYELETNEPDIKTIKQFANFYNVSLDYLLEHEQENQFDLGFLTEDQKTAIKMLTALNHINFIKAFSYISGLYASQN